MIEVLAKVAAAYALGSVMGGLLVGRLAGGVDVRSVGSRSAGTTNVLRTLGLRYAAPALLIDVVKGYLAAGLIPILPWLGGGTVSIDALAALCGAAAALGHVYPVWHGFRGGKAAATLLGALLAMFPLAVGPALAVWVVAILATGYVGLSTMLAGAAAVVAIAVAHPPGLYSPLGLFGLFMAAFLVFTHRANIARMAAGTENRFDTRRLFGRRRD
jgi:glycerol-3-phosphate acyltransferase PlsY